MRKLFLSLIAGFSMLVAPGQDHPVAAVNVSSPSQPLTAADWQSDLRFLQHTIHKDYSFLFKKVTSADFDAEVEKLYKAIPGMSENQRIAGIARIVSLFKYGHTSLGWRQMPFKYHVAPVNFCWFSDGIYAEGAHRDHSAIVGARLVKVEGKPVKDVLDAIKPLVPVENDQYFKAYGLDFLNIPQALQAQGITREVKSSVTYTFEKDGKTFDYIVKALESFHLPRAFGFSRVSDDWVSARDQSGTPYYLKHIEKNYYFEYIPSGKTVYVRQSQVLDDPQETIAAFYKKVFEFIDKNEVEKLVIDVRLNGGGNNYKNKAVVTGIVESKKINQVGKLFVITGKRTFSACQNLVNEFSNYTNALFVGEPTAENVNFYGDSRRVDLPKTSIPVFLSFAWWQDKPQWENADWLAPHLAVEMSFADYKANRDPVLETCLTFNGKDIVLDPMNHLRELFTAGKMDEVEREAKRMVADPIYRYVNFESKINDAGYNLLNGKQVDAALTVFGLNTKLFPQSANAWDSYAEAHWKAGKIEKAIEYYNKAIDLDPKGVTGENARNMLKQIRAPKGF